MLQRLVQSGLTPHEEQISAGAADLLSEARDVASEFHALHGESAARLGRMADAACAAPQLELLGAHGAFGVCAIARSRHPVSAVTGAGGY